MSFDWYGDIQQMHIHYDMTSKFLGMTPDKLEALLKFRLDFIQEELDEAKQAEVAEDVVDALIDIIVVAMGTLDAFDVNGQEAWDRVLAANLAKVPGVKPERPNPLGLPDLIKPEGWTAPTHVGLEGNLNKIF